jgi:hypothetical protein
MTASAVDEHERLILLALECGPAGKTELAARIGSLTEQQVIHGKTKAVERRLD